MGKGVVFDIQRFALHDGPGIRTTVFLKGCPLRCHWCHNPESQRMETEYLFDYEACSKCLAEGTLCPSGVKAVNLVERIDPVTSAKYKEWTADHDRTMITDSSIALCVKQAVKKAGIRESVDRMMKEVAEDLDYYRASGGGMTISGGEPLMQPEFVRNLAQCAKQMGIHVCLDTSGHAPQHVLADLLPWIDLYLFDYKATGAAKHKELTGVDNNKILSNLEFLSEHGADIILRCPLIPGVNDQPEHLQGIMDTAARYPQIREINVMPYHDMGNHKVERLGRTPNTALAALPTARPDQIDGWLSVLKKAPCPVSLG